MKSYLLIVILIASSSLVSFSQIVTGRGSITADRKTLINGEDSVNIFMLSPVTIISKRVFLNKRDQKRYDRLVEHVKKAYPYAKRAGVVLREEEALMVGMDRSERKAHMKKVQQRIEDQFGKELRNLTFTQGRILLKLIDRETGHTSYELLDDFRGSFRAWFYDGIAGLFGYDLKSDYDPKNRLEDKYIEEIVLMIESGQIALK